MTRSLQRRQLHSSGELSVLSANCLSAKRPLTPYFNVNVAKHILRLQKLSNSSGYKCFRHIRYCIFYIL